ncbi:hypothetical protein PPL_02571 [Heterostelium album PN500]|uniref:Uncharacterized protein n=1 Tax=Heterostelium pallidum (strain ATCC 26659 / Pp 5 / PN500) TaxID=670386 RepID=D3B2F9_HETP5|nr:hypothetical protein PPL_02571 [Heterostelium album PN500]EFA83507.1 hypothetical protein PPL_02571 [Heterostelium album PN500]|eukprot:XP_020435624.1 hypothetical protein PPL_02571 [Heterostelium album PN500]
MSSLSLSQSQSLFVGGSGGGSGNGHHQHSMSFIFSVDCDNEAMLYNLTNTEVELLDIRSHGACTFNSMVVVGDSIYTFGGDDFSSRYQRFSIKSKSIDMEGDIVGIEGGKDISVCFDGYENIYLLNGYKRSTLVISRFNLHTMQFISAHCHDGNGKIYIHSDDRRFFSINIDTKEIKQLKHLDLHFKNFCSMVYHQVDPSHSFIYLLGGKHYGNHRYSIESDKWQSVFKDSHSDRRTCGSLFYSLNTTTF